MATEITVPKLGLTMTEANLVKWAVASGQSVTIEEIVAVIETDKVSFEIVAPAAGLVHPVIDVGTMVAVSQVIGYVAADEAELASLQETHPLAAAGEAAPADTAAKKTTPVDSAEVGKDAGRIIASPLARRMAKEEGLDLALIPGTGPGGRIVEADIKKAMVAPPAAKSAPAAAAPAAAPSGGLLTVAEEIPIKGIRKVIFNNLHNSLSTQAQLTLETEASAMGMVGLRSFFKTADSTKVSYNAILVKAVARSLRKHPRLNAMVDGDIVKVWNEIHVGLAMDLGDGLIVPKVRCADTKSIVDLSAEIAALMEKARNKGLGPDDLQGGTFTITNLGAWGVDHFTPIVNFPESAILGVGRMVDKPWVVDGEVKIETRVCLSLTFDHRIIDGAPAAAFFKTLTQMIEEPRLML
jgi:pyruvate dehydrogenase E2 component (dihydrolipoamide acetyltransferase)